MSPMTWWWSLTSESGILTTSELDIASELPYIVSSLLAVLFAIQMFFSAATEMRIWIFALRYDCLFHIAAMHRGFSRSWHLSSWIHPMQVQWASATELHSVRWVRWLCVTNPGSCRGARRICVKALDAHRRTVLQCTYRQRNDTTW